VPTTSLTAKQIRFTEEYLVDCNATQAAIRAGYSSRTARAAGCKLLGIAEVADAISAGRARQAKRTEITQDWVLRSLVTNAERCMQSSPVTDKEGAPIGEYRHEPAAANKALELIGRHLGMFPTRHEVTGRDGGPLEPLIPIFADEVSADAARDLIAEMVARKRAEARRSLVASGGISTNGNGNGNGHRQ
jgi:phage terminase small subunit